MSNQDSNFGQELDFSRSWEITVTTIDLPVLVTSVGVERRGRTGPTCCMVTAQFTRISETNDFEDDENSVILFTEVLARMEELDSREEGGQLVEEEAEVGM